jgi:hypothetical protein
MGGILESLGSLLAAAGIDVPPWGFPALALAIMVVLLPRIIANMETGRARRLVQRSRGAEGEERRRMEHEALAVAGTRPMSLVAVAEEAIRARRGPLAEEAVARLAETGKEPEHLKRLRKELRKEDKLPASPVAAALVIERLVEGGAYDEATRRLRRFRRKWPAQPDLEAAAAHLASAQAAEQG